MSERIDQLDKWLEQIIWKNKDPMLNNEIKKKLKERYGCNVDRKTISNHLKQIDTIKISRYPKYTYQHKHHLTIQPAKKNQKGKGLSKKILDEIKDKLKKDLHNLKISKSKIKIIKPYIARNQQDIFSSADELPSEKHPYFLKACNQNKKFKDIYSDLKNFKKKVWQHENCHNNIKKEIRGIILKHFNVKTFNHLMKKRHSQKKINDAFFNPDKRAYLDKDTRQMIKMLHDLSQWVYGKLLNKEVLEEIENIPKVKSITKFKEICSKFTSNVVLENNIYRYYFEYSPFEGNRKIKKNYCWMAKKSKVQNKSLFQKNTDGSLRSIFGEISTSSKIKNEISNLLYYTNYLKHIIESMKEKL